MEEKWIKKTIKGLKMNTAILVILFYSTIEYGGMASTTVPMKDMKTCERQAAKLVRMKPVHRSEYSYYCLDNS